MALDKYTITVKLDAETSAIMQRVTENLVQIESLLTQTEILFTANLSEVLKVEITESEDQAPATEPEPTQPERPQPCEPCCLNRPLSPSAIDTIVATAASVFSRPPHSPPTRQSVPE